MSNFKNWLSANGKSIDMTGDAWQVHEIVDAYAGGLQARIAELEAALEKSNEAACMGAEIAAVFPVKFPADWEAPTHSLLGKEG